MIKITMSSKAELRTAALQLRTETTRIAKELDEHHENCVIASVAGGTIAVAGGVVAVAVGLATGPVGIPFTVAGSVACTSGSLISGGAGIANIVIDKVTIKRAQKKLDIFKEKYRQTIEDLTLGVPKEEILKLVTEIPRAYPLANAAKVIDGLIKGSGAPESVVKSASKSVFLSASKSGIASAENSGVLAFWAGLSVGTKLAIVNLALLPITVADLVLSSCELHKIQKKGKKSRAGDYIRDHTKALEDLERCCSEEIERENIQARKKEREKMKDLQRQLRQQEEEFAEKQKKAKQKEQHMRESARKDAEKLEESRRRARKEEEEWRELARKEKEELRREREELQELRRQLLTAGKAKNTYRQNYRE